MTYAKNRVAVQKIAQYHFGAICSLTKNVVDRNKLPAHIRKKSVVNTMFIARCMCLPEKTHLLIQDITDSSFFLGCEINDIKQRC